MNEYTIPDWLVTAWAWCGLGLLSLVVVVAILYPGIYLARLIASALRIWPMLLSFAANYHAGYRLKGDSWVWARRKNSDQYVYRRCDDCQAKHETAEDSP